MATIETVRTKEFSMDYIKFGHGPRNYVILPGLSVQSVMGAADAVIDAFSLAHEDFTLYLFDRRNELPAEYSIYDMAKDTAAAIKALGLNDIFLFGASQGGMIAMTIAIEYPELVKKLALGSTTSHVTKDEADGMNG